MGPTLSLFDGLTSVIQGWFTDRSVAARDAGTQSLIFYNYASYADPDLPLGCDVVRFETKNIVVIIITDVCLDADDGACSLKQLVMVTCRIHPGLTSRLASRFPRPLLLGTLHYLNYHYPLPSAITSHRALLLPSKVNLSSLHNTLLSKASTCRESPTTVHCIVF